MAMMPPVAFTYANVRIVQHCAVAGRLETPVRAYRIGAVAPRDGYPVSVSIAFIAPRKRLACYYRIKPDNLRYLTIEADDGEVVYDSRADVPCDMSAWATTKQEIAARYGAPCR